MRRWTCGFVLLVTAALVLGRDLESKRDSYQVLRVRPSSADDVTFLRELQRKYQLDVWRMASRVHQLSDILVSPHLKHEIRQLLDDFNLPHQVIIHDVERFLQVNDPLANRTRVARATSRGDYRNRYLSYTELLEFLREVELTSTQADVEVGSIGDSFEGRMTPYVKITGRNNTAAKGTIFIDAGVHSREWISPAMTVEIIHRLAYNVENDNAVTALLNLFDWIIVPLVNPDGYVFTFQPGIENRLWRKSRSTMYSDLPRCYGVDLNRNFGYEWNNSPQSGGSADPCSGTFSGPRSFSEPESRNLQQLLLRYRDRIQGYLSFHSFGQFFLYPWGYSIDARLEDEHDLYQVALAFADTMKARNYQYNIGGSAKVLYPAAGGSDDYVRGSVGVKYSYTVELPPHESSKYGFLLPESDVMSVVSDTWVGLKAFMLHLSRYTEPVPASSRTFQSPLTDTSPPQRATSDKMLTKTGQFRQNFQRPEFFRTYISDENRRKRQDGQPAKSRGFYTFRAFATKSRDRDNGTSLARLKRHKPYTKLDTKPYTKLDTKLDAKLDSGTSQARWTKRQKPDRKDKLEQKYRPGYLGK
ncbi:carboxypeptidase B1-like [Physella acuta]|uniref:carboxypeptidase B1-like n=1 Tax=Physella acuta TaxID=109671 RepID=UPI0027DDF9FC|nr:carboxypeptidase B1-like [Physella acuta]